MENLDQVDELKSSPELIAKKIDLWMLHFCTAYSGMGAFISLVEARR